MENSLNTPSSPSPSCYHILQSHPWPAHLCLCLADTCWRVRARAEAVCGWSLLEVPLGGQPKAVAPRKAGLTWPVWKQSKPVRGTLTAAQPQRCCLCRAVPQIDAPAAPGCPTSAATFPGPSPNRQQEKSLMGLENFERFFFNIFKYIF